MENTAVQSDLLAKYFKRILALIIDSMFLGLFGAALGFLFTSSFLSLGWKGRFVGFIITVLYFTICNSSILNGQTIGQKILKIKVVNSKGYNLTLSNSIIRSIFLPTIALLNNWTLPIFPSSFILQLIGFVFFSLIVLEAYFFIFNRNTKQLLHDVITNTYVINANDNNQIENLPHTSKTIILCSLFSFALVIVILLTVKLLSAKPTMTELLNIQTDLQNDYNMHHVSIYSGKTTFTKVNEPPNTVSYLRISCIKSNASIDEITITEQILTVLKKYPISKEVDTIELYFVTGYDIGISSQWKSTSKKYTKEEYLSLIE